jgi:hypothetical protein
MKPLLSDRPIDHSSSNLHNALLWSRENLNISLATVPRDSRPFMASNQEFISIINSPLVRFT